MITCMNGCVDDDDLEIVTDAYGTCSPGIICYADLTRDGVVDRNDLDLVWSVHCSNPEAFIDCCQGCASGFGAMPEPDIAALIQYVLDSNHSSEVKAQIICDIASHE